MKVQREHDQDKTHANEEAITQAMLDSGTSKTYVNSRQGMQHTKKSNKVVVTKNGTMLQASNIALLNTALLSKGAWEAIVVPGMQQKALLSVAMLVDNGYTVILSHCNLPRKQRGHLTECKASTLRVERRERIVDCTDH